MKEETVKLISMSADKSAAEIVVIARGRGGRKQSVTRHVLYNRQTGKYHDVDGRAYDLVKMAA